MTTRTTCTARAAPPGPANTGMVVALAEHSQVRELQRLHAAAGVTADQHEVAVGHDVVRQIAASGVPVPPRPARVAADPTARTPGSRRNSRPTGRSSGARRGENANQAGNAGRPASAGRSEGGPASTRTPTARGARGPARAEAPGGAGPAEPAGPRKRAVS